MQPDLSNQPQSLLYSGLGAVAVCLALEELGLVPQIKWPNDVLLEGRKVCGILVEAVWQAGEDEVSPAGWQAPGNVNLPALRWVVIGIGVNVKPASVPAETATRFPATCVEATLGQPVERWELLRSILQHLMEWLPKLDSAEYFKHWESRLAWRNQIVTISASDWQPDGFLVTDGSLLEGNLLGLDALGGLRLALQNGQVLVLYSGEVSLRLKSSQ
jgi:BirA family biotin operon repressor/biotin-[acetyl-CoA-carboxylase] ligase